MDASPNALDRLKVLVLDTLTSPESKRIYGRGIDRFLAWFRSERHSTGFTDTAVAAFQTHLMESGLSHSTVNMYLTAIRRLAAKAADNELLLPECASAISRVKGLRREPRRVGTRLKMFDLEKLANTPKTATLKGKRDRALLAVLIGCGLSREEAASLKIEDLQHRQARWVIFNLVGKGRNVRSVPIPPRVKTAIDRWTEAAAICTGRIFRAVNKGDRVVGDGITAQSVFETVKQYAAQSGFDYLAPDDLRTTYTRLIRKDSAELENIRIL